MWQRVMTAVKLIKAGREFTLPFLNRPLVAVNIFFFAYTLCSFLLYTVGISLNAIYFITLLIVPLSIIAFKFENVFYSLIGDNLKSRERADKYRILTSGFIHADYMHLIFNLLTLYLIGLPLTNSLEYEVAWLASPLILLGFLFGVYCGGELTLRTKFGELNRLHLGSSSGVLAILTLFVLENPSQDILIFGLLQFNNITFLILFTILTVISLFKFMPVFDMILSFSRKRINHAGHLGGVLAGLLIYVVSSIGIKLFL